MSTTSKKTTKLFIPHPRDECVSIAGVLEQVAPEQPTHGRKLALILHGTMGHKDYLFQKRLALRLPIDSLRIDFRGNHETPGEWRSGAFDNDLADIEAVVAYITKEYGYVFDLIVGHSRGVVSALRWMCVSEEGKAVRGFVNVSGRYRMNKIYDGAKQYKEDLETQGYYEARAMVARKPFVGKVTAGDLEEFANFDSSYVWDRFPATPHVLSIHGLDDKVVPSYDAMIYARALGARHPGTHNLCYVEAADHNFTGMSDFVVATILEWWNVLEQRQLKTGIWGTGIRGKL